MSNSPAVLIDENEQIDGQSSSRPAENPTFAVLKATAIQQALGHPLTYARVLMQIGYEPLPACRGKTLFGREAYFYPNVFRYLKYVYNIDGFTGLYRGFGCTVLSNMVRLYVTTQVDQLIGPVESSTEKNPAQPTLNQCVKKTLREVGCQSFGILVSHPFQVMAIRAMGQFIGRENIYSSINIFQNIQTIYQQEGLGGFFVGLIPRWLLEIATIIISNSVIHLFKSGSSLQNEFVPMYEYMAAIIAQTVTYPLSVVTTVTVMNQSGLRAGMSPIYANWQDAYTRLSKTEQLKRGSSLFNRTAFSNVAIPAPGTPIPNA